jgi:preprotein translocase subunit SecA
MDALRDGIGLRGYGQKDPKQEYKKEGFLLFQQVIYGIRDAAVRALSRVQLRSEVREQEFHHKDETPTCSIPAAARPPKPSRNPSAAPRPRSAATIPALRFRQEVQEVLRQ